MGKGLEGKTESAEIIYSKNDALKDSLNYFKGNKIAAEQFLRKYALKDLKGNLYESNPDQMHRRMAREIARIELKKGRKDPLSEEEAYLLFKDFKYLVPGGSNMAGIGNNKQIISLSNCFVIGNEGKSDSYGGIMKIDQEQVQLMKRRGGVGHDLSHIRPNESLVNNSALTSTGVVPFMERYSNSTKEVAQGGRRGALMLSISIKHPNAENAIDAKMKEGKVTNANVSIKVDDEFMNAVKNDEMYTQQFPIDSDNPSITKEINARELWDKIITNAWKKGEPGVLFWDTIIRESIPDCYSDLGYKTVSTNPCGEIPLCPYDSCRLLAINLYNYVSKPFASDASFDFAKFKKHTHLAQRIMDDIVDLEEEKIEGILEKIDSDPEDKETKAIERNVWDKILYKTRQGRRAGIGITAEGDMLAALGLRYGTDKATDFAEEVQKKLAIETYRASVRLAKTRGAFEIYDSEKEKDNPFINRLKKEDPQLYNEMIKYGRRNLALLTIAPTGTVSLMTKTTSGIEPLFLPAYKRNVKIDSNNKDTEIDYTDEEGNNWHTYTIIHPKFEEWMGVKGISLEELTKIKDKKEFKEKVKELAKKSPYYKATSADIDWVKKVEMQGKIQQWVDHSISATTNMPKGTPKEVVSEAYMKAWESGCKGMTVYVDGSRGKGVLNSGDEKEFIIPVGSINNPVDLPDIMPALRITQRTPFGKMHVFTVFDPSSYTVRETFGSIGNVGEREAANMEEIGRMSSLWLKSGGNLENIIKQLKGIGSGRSTISRDGEVSSLGMGFSKALLKYLVVNDMVNPLDLFSGKVDLYKLGEDVSDEVRKVRGDWKKYINGNESNPKKTEEEVPKTKKYENNDLEEEEESHLIKCKECGEMAYDPTEGCGICTGCGFSGC